MEVAIKRRQTNTDLKFFKLSIWKSTSKAVVRRMHDAGGGDVQSRVNLP